MLNIFIGSSSECYTPLVVPFRKKLRCAAESENVSLDIAAWRDSAVFMPNDYTLDSLHRRLRDSDIGIFFFAKDDQQTKRGSTGFVPRDNVIFEAGMFLGLLGRERTIMLLEDNVTAPSDLAGLTIRKFSNATRGDLESDFDSNVSELISLFKRLAPVRQAARYEKFTPFGLANTLEKMGEALSHNESALIHSADTRRIVTPVSFGAEACLNAYVEALSKVKSRFWTTTYFSSGFWRSSAGTVLAANHAMLNRLSSQPQSDVRRLFLLPVEIDRFIRQEINSLTQLRRAHLSEEIREKETFLSSVRHYVENLRDNGCRVRIGHDVDDGFFRNRLSKELQENCDPSDTEIAIFDKFRIDMYGGGKTQNISSLRIFPDLYDNFDVHLNRAEQYFEALWDSSSDADQTIRAWHQSFQRAKSRVDYNSNWIARYEYDLEPGDRILKQSEFQAALDSLKSLHVFGEINSYLDIGTCTARYPLEMIETGAVTEGAAVFGLDEDPDCIDFARAKLEQRKRLDQITLVEADFMSEADVDEEVEGTFELVTCMLGTLSHFSGGESNPGEMDRRTLLESVLRRMKRLMKPGGVLLIGNWSDQARRAKRLLSIYGEHDVARLCAWTSSKIELKTALEQVGLSIFRIQPVDGRIDLFACR